MIQRRDRIISKVKQHGAKKYVNKTIKFGKEFLKMLHESMELDKNNGRSIFPKPLGKSNAVCGL